MRWLSPQPPVGRFRHLALFYHGRSEYVAVLAGFIQASLAQGDAVFVAIPEGNAQLLRQELGEDSARLFMVDMAELGRNPARIIPEVRAFARRVSGAARALYRRADLAGPLDRGDIPEAARHEALLNLAFDADRDHLCVPLWQRRASGLGPYRRGQHPPGRHQGRKTDTRASYLGPGVFRRCVIGRCPARRTAEALGYRTICGRCAAWSPQGRWVGLTPTRIPDWCSPPANSPPTPCAIPRAAAR